MINHQPLVSVCIPVYNGEKFLSECILSVKNQVYNNIEIILVDDNSTDNSLKIALGLLQDFEKKTVCKNDINLGLVCNWEKCISLAKGDWIKFIFQDDIMAPFCISTLIENAIQNQVEFVFCSRKFLFEEGVSPDTIHYYQHQLVKPENIFPSNKVTLPETISTRIYPFLASNVIGEPVCWLFHRELYNRIGGFNHKILLFLDYEFVLRVILNNPCVFISDMLIYFRVHNESTSVKNANKKKILHFSDSQIRGQFGDIMEMINQFITNNQLSSIKEKWEPKLLEYYFIYTYLRICKLVGESRVKGILNDIIIASPYIHKLSYSRIKYEFYKYYFNKYVLPILNKLPKTLR